MKFIIKAGSNVKLYSGQIKMEALALFLKENFSSWNQTNLIYTDNDGDKISVTRQQDLESLTELNHNSQYLKLQIKQRQSGSQKEDLKHQGVQDQNQQIKQTFLSTANKCQRNQQSRSLKTHSKPKWNREERRRQKSLKKIQERKVSQNKDQKRSRCQRKREKMQKIEKAITQKLVSLVDQRVKSLIPCIKNQLYQTVQQSTIENSTDLKHQGIICNGCNKIPITNIRYKCLECPIFNLCQACQTKIEHQHNLLKMKKPEVLSNQAKQCQDKDFRKIGKTLFNQVFGHHHSSSESEHEHHHRRHHGHWRGKNKLSYQDRSQFKLQKKLFKLKAMFGQQNNFKDFIQRNPHLRCRDLIDVYAAENKISSQEFQMKKDKMRKEKLSSFFDCPQSQFDEIIKQNPKLNFREIISLLKQTGKRTYNGENFKRMREKWRDMRWGQEKCKIKRFSKSKSISKSKSKGKLVASQRSGLSDKEKFVFEMKNLFGEENLKQYFDFVENNFSLGQQGIIDKWISEKSL